MKILKTAIAALSLCLLITQTSFASNNPTTTISKSLRTELSTLVQNPELAKHHLQSGYIDVQFSVDETGKISILQSNSPSSYLTQFIQKKINGQQLDSENFTPNQNYLVRFRFELE